MNQITIGAYVALKRKKQNMTQAQLAERLGVSDKTISKWETGKCKGHSHLRISEPCYTE